MSFLDRVVDDEYITLILEHRDSGDIYVHATVNEWGMSAYRSILSTWVDILAVLKARGVPKVYAEAPCNEDEEKVLRFQMMFGFTPVAINEYDTGKQYYLSELVVNDGNC